MQALPNWAVQDQGGSAPLRRLAPPATGLSLERPAPRGRAFGAASRLDQLTTARPRRAAPWVPRLCYAACSHGPAGRQRVLSVVACTLTVGDGGMRCRSQKHANRSSRVGSGSETRATFSRLRVHCLPTSTYSSMI